VQPGVAFRTVKSKIRRVAARPKGRGKSDTGSKPGGAKHRAGGRSARVVAEVLRATADELARVGYSALRMDDVAHAAGVNKTTVYRRWPTKMLLVTEAMRCERELRLMAPDTGSLREDMRVMLHMFAEQGRSPLARAWISELANPEVRTIMEGSRHYIEEQWAALVARGMARGELPPETSPLFLVEVVMAPVVGRIVRGDELPTDQFCDQVIDLVLAGARAVAPPRSVPRVAPAPATRARRTARAARG
jgi:AcrR family transcriptional regulator